MKTLRIFFYTASAIILMASLASAAPLMEFRDIFKSPTPKTYSNPGKCSVNIDAMNDSCEVICTKPAPSDALLCRQSFSGRNFCGGKSGDVTCYQEYPKPGEPGDYYCKKDGQEVCRGNGPMIGLLPFGDL